MAHRKEPGSMRDTSKALQRCPGCNGTGRQMGPDGRTHVCDTCDGMGMLPAHNPAPVNAAEARAAIADDVDSLGNTR